MKVAVVGSNGFLGSHLTKKISQIPGISLFLFGRSEASIFGDRFPYAKIDITNRESVLAHFADIDTVYYLASATIPATSWERPTVEIEQNLLPFINFLESLSSLKIRKFVFISSAGTIYGRTEHAAKETSFTSPFSPYGITKLTMEFFLNYFNARCNINFDVYRVSNVYGEGQDVNKGMGIINTFLEHIVSNSSIHVFGNGENVRNYLYADDFAELLTLSLRAGSQSEVYNVSSNDTVSINELVSIIKSVVDENFEVKYIPSRQSDNPAIYIDNSKIRTAFPAFKFTGLEEGILKTYQYIKKRAAPAVNR